MTKYGNLAIYPNMQAQECKTTPFKLRSAQDYRSGAEVFKALGHASRLLIVDALSHGERCVADLTTLIGSDMSTVSNHLSVLKNVGLIEDERRGQQVFYRLATPCVMKAFSCMEEMRKTRRKRG